MSFVGGFTGDESIVAAGIEAAWKAPLAILTAAYSLVKQYDIIQEQLAIADRQIALGERYVGIAQASYNNIAAPTYNNLQALYTRYATQFQGYEPTYLNEAFRTLTYVPNYVAQEGRAIGRVQMRLDHMHRSKQLQTSKYNVGRVRWDAAWFAAKTAQARLDAINIGYRTEEERLKWFTEFYWHKHASGAHMLEGMAHNVVLGIVGGSNTAANGLRGIGEGFKVLDEGYDLLQGSLANEAGFWGHLGNGAMAYLGDTMGRKDAKSSQSKQSWAAGTTVEAAS